ncbi:alpha/beta hydrolase [Rhodococcus sp. PAMC28707]|uniref:alpha/beta fold hydrolase n=1 Tax=unclassified Rhodococcus (in: high G+C Gram-positive bacteria) TaxID=192944 RepID=UPI00109D84E7|nr:MULTISPECIES: alpha/beta hydrolase [unclassified Rhodococcus (in: high G+C Gram-positive bacteria)]QCB49508.1 alpha/beta hydrolase [Rhodococcus sp. PAMC28705]QCB58802.1 alpha/beta hydrolase [Rhodococcus sp. PAMC28707]
MFHMKQSPPGRFVAVDGLRTHVVVTGGGPPIVLCGGLAGNWFDWDDAAAILSTFHTVVVFDRPGFGFSEPFPHGDTPTVEAEAARILGVLDALELPGPAVVVGHSIAGFYAEAFARLYPSRTAGMLLLDSSAERDPRHLIPRHCRISAAYVLSRTLTTLGLQRLLGTTVRRILNQSIPPDGIPIETYDWIAQIYRAPSYLEAALVEDFVYPDMALELNQIRRSHPMPDVPATVVAAHTGRPTPWGRRWIAKQRRLAQYLDAKFSVVTNAHHHAMIDQPAEVASLIAELV